MSAASRNQGILKQTIRLFSTPRKVEGFAGGDDFDEADVWTCQPESKPDNPIRSSAPRSRSAWKKTAKESSRSGSGSGSIPVHVPDWPKVLQHDYKNSRSYYKERAEEDDDDDEEEIVPPHEVVMRRRAASLSVVEGEGRTLKGRDLSRVRNAIWAQTGFQD